MKIKVFESGSGMRFLITTANPTEQALLAACISDRGKTLQESGDDVSEFHLRLPVSNG